MLASLFKLGMVSTVGKQNNNRTHIKQNNIILEFLTKTCIVPMEKGDFTYRLLGV